MCKSMLSLLKILDMKRILYLTTCAIFALFFIVSCNKNKGNFILTGTVSDESFNQNLSGATVELYQIPIGSTNAELVGSATTDASGAYKFTFKREKMEKYRLVVSKNLYFSQETEMSFSEFSLKEETVKNVSTTAKAWVRITLTNNAPLSTDQLDYTKQSGKVNCLECCAAEPVSYYGALDTTFYCVNDGNTIYSFLYSATGIGSGIKSITTTAFDTVNLSLSY